ncbi:O-methyltransferase [Pyrenophora tritici-repentis]|uniref:O-methyltransferase n=2 Tax=Pyrenophora tritici-repentis TaxID=45151 RepID=A0A2W1DU74_9PLEO|nr:O-methyltransferase [Pyrenophora tritici-repentis Pt-1C-BFP]KAA8619658.1 o-methyltransferase [Pyrenophora tritici-repentis]EDU47091.1 O-methyltransferase [Pyrenophora tritici-repentis Pt-1C-BFP]KAF7447794.1 o-methyltransferase [Pyrenophora tritici-repentis]KAF7571500.1 O-methyltransferase [Pyrenophora tritici-repentis]KAG9385275.1 o-methyltransferase [Pyrenophora tritici-repentis]
MGSIGAEDVNPRVIAEAEKLLLSLKTHNGGAKDQAKALRHLEKLRCMIHTGFDALLFHAQPFQILPAVNVLIEHGVFDAVPPEGKMSIEDIASKVKLDATILNRFIRILLTQGIFAETSPRVIAHTPASSIFRSDQAADFYRLGMTQFPQWWKVSDYLKVHSASDAYDATKVPYVWAQGKEGKTYYEAMEEDPIVADAWHKGMVMIESMQPVTGMFPFRSMLEEIDVDKKRAFVVDVGGGRGNALVAIMAECGASVAGRMVLQDVAEVLEGKSPVRIDGVQIMPHNFYDPQPVKNAHVYYLRNVLHNHYDVLSEIILRQIVGAMEPDSRVLIGEMILPSTVTAGSDPMPYFMDLNMFMEGGIERTEEQWIELLDAVGLEIVKIWRLTVNPVQATIEARLKG